MKRQLDDPNSDAPPVKKLKFTLCKTGCGHPVAPGTTKSGNPFDTCCKECAVKPEDNLHSWACRSRYKDMLKSDLTPIQSWDDFQALIDDKAKKLIYEPARESIDNSVPDDFVALIAEYAQPRLPKRPFWKIKLEETAVPLTGSKIGGKPYLPQGTEWPKCLHCQSFMPLFVQLNTDDLPEKFDGLDRTRIAGQVLQLFYCVSDCDEGFEPFSGSHCVQLVPVDPANARDEAYLNEVIDKIQTNPDGSFSCKELAIKKFVEGDHMEGPNSEEFSEAFEWYSELEETANMDDFWDLDEVQPEGEDKLFGYPCWVQGVEYPTCTECDELMMNVFQFSGDAIDFMFGDCGIGHVTICPEHLESATFAWACS